MACHFLNAMPYIIQVGVRVFNGHWTVSPIGDALQGFRVSCGANSENSPMVKLNWEWTSSTERRVQRQQNE